MPPAGSVSLASVPHSVFHGELILPFSRVAMLFGEPCEVPSDVKGKRLEEFRLQLETKLRNLFDISQNYFAKK